MAEARRRTARRTTREQFAKVFGKPLETAWDEWIAWEHEFQAANLHSVREHPLTSGRRLTRQALGSVSRSFYDATTNSLIGAFQYPGVVAYAGVVSLDDGSIRKLVDIKGPMKFRVASTAFDPGTRTLFYTADNYDSWRDLMAVDVDSGQARMLLKDARIGDICFDESDRSLWGLRHSQRLRDPGTHPVPLHRAGTRSIPGPTATCPSNSTCRLTAPCYPCRSGRSTARSS